MAQRRRYIWIVAAALGALAAAMAGWRVEQDLIRPAFSSQTRLSEFSRLMVIQPTQENTQALASLQQTVTRLEREVLPAASLMDWLWRFSPAIAWLPAADQEVSAWAVQTERLQKDIESASTLLNASSLLLETYYEAEDMLLRPGAPTPSAALKRKAADLESSYATVLDELASVISVSRRHTPAIRMYPFGEALQLLDETEERMLSAGRVGREATLLLAELLETSELVRPLLLEFASDQGGLKPLTLEALKTTLTDLDRRLQSALARSNRLAKLMTQADYGGQLMERLGVMEDALEVLLNVTLASSAGLEAVEPVLQSTRTSGAGLLDADAGLVSAMRAVIGKQDEIDKALVLLEEAQLALAELKSRSQPPQGLGELERTVEVLSDGLTLLKEIAPFGADLLGAGSTRRYLVLGQSADELRATGGFVSSIWLVTFENGGLADIRYHGTVRVDDWERLDLYPRAPQGLEEHMNAHVWLLRDVSWEPDFPSTALVAADMYKIGQGRDVDGVVALNQWTLLSIVEALGGVPSPGGESPLTPQNLLSRLEQGSDEHGRAYMDLALQGIIGQINQPVSLPDIMRLASTLGQSLQRRDLMLFLEDPQLQEVVRNNGWDGGLRHDATDYLYVVDSNAGWSKADRNIERRVTYQVDLTRGRVPEPA